MCELLTFFLPCPRVFLSRTKKASATAKFPAGMESSGYFIRTQERSTAPGVGCAGSGETENYPEMVQSYSPGTSWKLAQRCWSGFFLVSRESLSHLLCAPEHINKENRNVLQHRIHSPQSQQSIHNKQERQVLPHTCNTW